MVDSAQCAPSPETTWEVPAELLTEVRARLGKRGQSTDQTGKTMWREGLLQMFIGQIEKGSFLGWVWKGTGIFFLESG